MRKSVLVLLVAVFALSLVGPALGAPTPSDPPSWWDNADKQRSDTVTIENTAGTGQSEGTYTVFLENLDLPDRYKEVYLTTSMGVSTWTRMSPSPGRAAPRLPASRWS